MPVCVMWNSGLESGWEKGISEDPIAPEEGLQ